MFFRPFQAVKATWIVVLVNGSNFRDFLGISASRHARQDLDSKLLILLLKVVNAHKRTYFQPLWPTFT